MNTRWYNHPIRAKLRQWTRAYPGREAVNTGWLSYIMKGVILVCILSSCSHYTKTEKALFTGMVIANTADIYTTSRILSEGGHELNPVLGDHPSDGKLAIAGALNMGLMMVLGEIWPEWRPYIFGASMTVHGGCAVWNVGQF